MIRLFLLPVMVFVLLGCQAIENTCEINSPDGSISVQLTVTDGAPHYRVSIDGEEIIKPSKLGFELASAPELDGELLLEELQRTEEQQDWEQVLGEDKQIRDHHVFARYRVLVGDTEFYALEFKVFNDGVGFRYLFPDWDDVDSLLIEEELTEFNFADDYESWWIPADWDSYEEVYRNTPISESPGANTPVTMRTRSGVHISIHEANLTDYAGMTLKPDGKGATDWHSELVPWPGGLKVRGDLPHRSPWRTIQLGRSAPDLANSHLILNLNEPSRLEDVSWIRPMKYMGIWWAIHIDKYSFEQGPDHGATTENALRYIDFAAENGFHGLLIEGWNIGWENWGEPDAYRFTEPCDDFDIEKITTYAAERGVEIIGHHETGGDAGNYDRRVEDGFKFYKRHGINVVKTGYAGDIYPRGFFHHGQWMVRHYRRIVELAADYRILLNVHEPIKPTGIRRTWPHMFTREGARGGEYEAWSSGNPPGHTSVLPFTRMLAGPMDYTPGIFHVSLDGFKEENRVHTTLAHQLALAVVLYSPLQMAADLPEHYEGHEAFQFYRDLKVNWDESEVLDGVVGDYVVTVRRADEEWFLAAITDEQARELITPLDFLDGDTTYRVEVYRDSDDASWEDNPTAYTIEEFRLTSEDILEIKMATCGGYAARFVPLG